MSRMGVWEETYSVTEMSGRGYIVAVIVGWREKGDGLVRLQASIRQMSRALETKSRRYAVHDVENERASVDL